MAILDITTNEQKLINFLTVITSLTKYQAKMLFIIKNLSLEKDERKPCYDDPLKPFWILYQNGDQIGGIFKEKKGWISNTRWIGDVYCNNPYSASLLELMQNPVAGIYSDQYAKEWLKEQKKQL